jgi:hypothetical protein
LSKLKHLSLKRKFILAFFVALLFAGFEIGISLGNKGNGRQLATSKRLNAISSSGLLQSGDLIFRHGKGFISDAFRRFSLKDKKYSHAGIIAIENEQVFVYHAIGGEENVSNKLKKNTLSEFCAPDNAQSFGVYRYILSETEKTELMRLSRLYYRQGLEFDLSFDLKTDDKMYCSEFIYKMLTKVKSNKFFLPLSEVNGLKYVAIDDLYMNSGCEAVYSFNY